MLPSIFMILSYIYIFLNVVTSPEPNVYHRVYTQLFYAPGNDASEFDLKQILNEEYNATNPDKVGLKFARTILQDGHWIKDQYLTLDKNNNYKKRFPKNNVCLYTQSSVATQSALLHHSLSVNSKENETNLEVVPDHMLLKNLDKNAKSVLESLFKSKNISQYISVINQLEEQLKHVLSPLSLFMLGEYLKDLNRDDLAKNDFPINNISKQHLFDLCNQLYITYQEDKAARKMIGEEFMRRLYEIYLHNRDCYKSNYEDASCNGLKMLDIFVINTLQFSALLGSLPVTFGIADAIRLVAFELYADQNSNFYFTVSSKLEKSGLDKSYVRYIGCEEYCPLTQFQELHSIDILETNEKKDTVQHNVLLVQAGDDDNTTVPSNVTSTTSSSTIEPNKSTESTTTTNTTLITTTQVTPPANESTSSSTITTNNTTASSISTSKKSTTPVSTSTPTPTINRRTKLLLGFSSGFALVFFITTVFLGVLLLRSRNPANQGYSLIA